MSTAYDEALASYEPVFGLETHVELGTKSKMFCGCSTTFGAAPNTHTCPTCLGCPAHCQSRTRWRSSRRSASVSRCIAPRFVVPVRAQELLLSRHAEELPDLAVRRTVVRRGYLDVEVQGSIVRVGIERVHLEEDTGKSLHVGGSTGRIHGATHSLVDYNRAGIPLVEIVTKPVPGTGAMAPEVARAYVTELRETLRTLNVSDVRMEEGSLRCDVNLSLNPVGATEWGTRSETKNVNSLRSVERAVRSEIERQASVLRDGGRSSRRHGTFTKTAASRRPGEVRSKRGLPLLSRARPGSDCTGRCVGRGIARHTARVALR